MSLYVSRSGTGPPVVLVHGGLPASVTWARQQELEARWSLIIPSRRGFAPNPVTPFQDFLVDADDLAELISRVPDGAHLVGFSYGGLSASITAGRLPYQVRSLTLLEVPLWTAAEDDESVRGLASLADRFAASADDEQAEDEFYALAGVNRTMLEGPDDEIRQAMLLWRELRSPREAKPEFDAIIAAGIPTLVVSGDHHPGMERLCDAVATRLGAQRVQLPGAGHAVQRAPGFNPILETFLTAAENRFTTESESRLARRIGQDFPQTGAAAEIRRLLARLPLDSDDEMLGTERVHAAVILFAQGDIARFHDALELSKRDWRDLLVAAGLANEDWPARLDRELGPAAGNPATRSVLTGGDHPRTQGADLGC